MQCDRGATVARGVLRPSDLRLVQSVLSNLVPYTPSYPTSNVRIIGEVRLDIRRPLLQVVISLF